MIVTRQWLMEHIDLSAISNDEIVKALNAIGLEVDSVTNISIPEGIQIGFIESCEPHQDANKLSVCQVDLGYTKVQIVCGASNVASGQYVPVATVGTMLDNGLSIQASTLRGVASDGMICSSTEIGLPKTNNGIMVLDDSIGELVLGKELGSYPLINDTIIEIELTPNRGDCLNIIGVAKELCAYFSLPLLVHEKAIQEYHEAIGRALDVNYQTTAPLNVIYRVADIRNFTLPILYKIRIGWIGIETGYDIEKLSEYATHTTGVLLNIYTKNSVVDNEHMKIMIRDNEAGFSTICGNSTLCVAGLEKNTLETDDVTVIVETSYLEPVYLAKKVFATKQKTGAVYYRSSRGSNPNLEMGLDYFIALLSLFGAKIYKGQLHFVRELEPRIVDVSLQAIHKIIGQVIEKKTIESIMTSLGFIEICKTNPTSNDTMTFQIPLERHDIINIADIAEEIVRMIGIDNIVPQPLLFGEMNSTNEISSQVAKKNLFRIYAIGCGFFETTTYIFTSRELLLKYGCKVVDHSLDILNPITSELNSFRTNLLINLLDGVSRNQKNGLQSIALFEIGTIFNERREESKAIGFVWSGGIEDPKVKNSGKPSKIDFYSFAEKISQVIGEFSLVPKESFEDKLLHPYQSAMIIQNNKEIGYISKIHPLVAKDFDISDATFVAHIDCKQIEYRLKYAHNFSKYQAVKRDLSLMVPKSLPFGSICSVIDALKIGELMEYTLIDIYEDRSFEDMQSLTITFVLQSFEKTLEESEIVAIMNSVIESLDQKLSLRLR